MMVISALLLPVREVVTKAKSDIDFVKTRSIVHVINTNVQLLILRTGDIIDTVSN